MNSNFSSVGFNPLKFPENPQNDSEKDQDSHSSALQVKVARRALQKMDQSPRRSKRVTRSSIKLKESMESESTSPRSKGIKKRRTVKERATKIARVINEENFLHHYPIRQKAIENIISSLKDQRKRIEKLSANEVRKLDSAIQKSDATGAYPGIKIIALGKPLGSGAFLDPMSKPLKKGTILGIYSGEYKIFQIDYLGDTDLSYAFELTDIISLDKDEHQELFGNLNTWSDDGDYVVYCDALNKGNWIRFLNHGGQLANCEAQLVRYPSKGKMRTDTEQWVVVVRTLETIQPGEQLLLNYGKNYWKKYGLEPKAVSPSQYTLVQDKIIRIV